MNLSVSSFPATTNIQSKPSFSSGGSKGKGSLRIAGWLAGISNARSPNEKSRIHSYQPTRPTLHALSIPKTPEELDETHYPTTPIVKDISTKETIQALGLVDTVESHNLRRLITHPSSEVQQSHAKVHAWRMKPMLTPPSSETDSSTHTSPHSTPMTSPDSGIRPFKGPIFSSGPLASLQPVSSDGAIALRLPISELPLAPSITPMPAASTSIKAMEHPNNSTGSIAGRGRRAMPPAPLVLKKSSHKRRSRSVPTLPTIRPSEVAIPERHRPTPLIIKKRGVVEVLPLKQLSTSRPRPKALTKAQIAGSLSSIRALSEPDIHERQVVESARSPTEPYGGIVVPAASPRPLPSPPTFALPAAPVTVAPAPPLSTLPEIVVTNTKPTPKKSLPAVPQATSSNGPDPNSLSARLIRPPSERPRPSLRSPSLPWSPPGEWASGPTLDEVTSRGRQQSEPLLSTSHKPSPDRGSFVINSAAFASWDSEDLRPLSLLPIVNLSSSSIGSVKTNEEEEGPTGAKPTCRVLKYLTKKR